MDPKKIAKKGSIIDLEDNKDLAKSYWIAIENETGASEGKLHIPQKNTDKLVIYEPGFPGGGSGYFEETMLRQVLKDGYAVYIIRHVGTIINGKYSSGYIVCDEKQQQAKKIKQQVLGVKEFHTIGDWLLEPKVALEVLSPHFEKIVLVGHSFGPLAEFTSLLSFTKENPDLAVKVKRFISMAGTLGIVRDVRGKILSQWKEYLDKSWSKERVLIGNTDENLELLHQAYKTVHEEARSFPKSIDFMAIHPWGDEQGTTDELVHIKESLDAITSLGRGYLIVDKTEWGDKKTGRIAHDMENLSSEFFSKLVDLNWLPKSQISTIR